jgi:hypothetical protein
MDTAPDAGGPEESLRKPDRQRGSSADHKPRITKSRGSDSCSPSSRSGLGSGVFFRTVPGRWADSSRPAESVGFHGHHTQLLTSSCPPAFLGNSDPGHGVQYVPGIGPSRSLAGYLDVRRWRGQATSRFAPVIPRRKPRRNSDSSFPAHLDRPADAWNADRCLRSLISPFSPFSRQQMAVCFRPSLLSALMRCTP